VRQFTPRTDSVRHAREGSRHADCTSARLSPRSVASSRQAQPEPAHDEGMATRIGTHHLNLFCVACSVLSCPVLRSFPKRLLQWNGRRARRERAGAA
jgi:hypothetical protein